MILEKGFPVFIRDLIKDFIGGEGHIKFDASILIKENKFLINFLEDLHKKSKDIKPKCYLNFERFPAKSYRSFIHDYLRNEGIEAPQDYIGCVDFSITCYFVTEETVKIEEEKCKLHLKKILELFRFFYKINDSISELICEDLE